MAYDRGADDREREARAWKTRLTVSAALTVPVVALSMIPALQFDNWHWISLALASPFVVWGALPFHRAAWTNLRHGVALGKTGTTTTGHMGGVAVHPAEGESVDDVLRYAGLLEDASEVSFGVATDHGGHVSLH